MGLWGFWGLAGFEFRNSIRNTYPSKPYIPDLKVSGSTCPGLFCRVTDAEINGTISCSACMSCFGKYKTFPKEGVVGYGLKALE